MPAIEEHINALKADRETAIAMDADAFVVRNLADQAAAFTEVAHTMRSRLTNLSEDERAEVEHAAAVLRKMRASRDTTLGPSADIESGLARGRPLLPLIATRTSSTDQGTA